MIQHTLRRRLRAPLVRLACTCVLLLFAAGAHLAAYAATPVIVTEATSTRAVAIDAVTKLRDPFPLTTPGFTAGADTRTRVMFFVLNLDLLAGEGANALTAEAEDSTGRKYALTVENIASVPAFGALQQVVVRLPDDMGDVGDVLVRINLHGMSSNRVRISVGHAGGGIPDDPNSSPAPAPAVPPAPTPTPTPNQYTAASTNADTVRLLEQATWGPTPAEVARVQALGLRAYLNEQFNAPLSSYPNLTLMPIDQALGCPTGSPATCGRDNYTIYPVQVKFFQNALAGGAGSDQLRQRVAFALHQIFVVSGRDINQPAWMAYYLQILDRNAFGNFRTLLQEITLNPGMGRYLDTVGNTSANPNENYAREVLQLFSIGLDELNLDGTPKLDAQGKRIPTYDQDDVTAFARVFTGLVFAAPPAGTQGVVNYRDPMVVSTRNGAETNHDRNQKVLLNGTVLPPNQSTMTDINAALDNIFNHPNTAPFIGKQLIQHLVTSNPSPAYVERVARVFNNNCDALYPDNCTNSRGDLRAVVRAILLDPEARGDAKTDPNYGKLREPVQYINNILRAFNATSDGVIGTRSRNGDLPGALDQPVFLPATVFSYYSPLYEVPGTKLFGPAFEILSTSTALRRANTANTLIYQGILTNADTPTGTQLNLSALEAQADNPAQLLDTLDALLLHNTMSATMRAQVLSAIASINDTDASVRTRKRARTAVYLVVTSPQYQVQR
ncbi:MAG TPA: DUF1800 domain-containing protein [Pyrinomonadaceae bacterium]|nr:DUF1800 domain-containing protein [Pyrinomonadaceae bacterium]